MADAVIDIEALGGGEVDAGIEGAGQDDQGQHQQQPDAAQKRADEKAYSDYIKSLREDGDGSKFAKRLKDDYGRLQAITKIDPKGIDGIRSHYDTLNGVAHGDKTGIEAVQSIQEALAESQTILDAVAQGNMDSLSDEQKDGIYRMAPAVIADLAESNQEAYQALLLPHFVEGLKGSPLYSSLNGLLGALNEQPPSFLTKEQIPQWTLLHLEKVTGFAKNMGQWFQAQDQRVKELGGKDSSRQAGGPVDRTTTQSGPPKEFWEKIGPQTDQHVRDTFAKDLRPWAEKLAKAGIRLSDAKKESLVRELGRDVTALAQKNSAYMNQVKRFNSQRSPDAASVVSTFRSEFNRHAKTVLDGLIRRDYGQVLDKGTKVTPKSGAGGNGTKPAPQTGVRFVGVKPNKESLAPNFKRPIDWIYTDKYKLRDGTVVQYKP